MLNRVNRAESRSRSNSAEQFNQNAVSGESSLNKMKNMQRGTGHSAESLENSTESETSTSKPNSRSPSHSPQIHRKGQRGAVAAPPPPRRAPQTSLTAMQTGQNRHSLSSSTSSLSSNFSERTTGSYDVGVSRLQGEMIAQQEAPPKLPIKKSKRQVVPVQTKPLKGVYVCVCVYLYKCVITILHNSITFR